MRRADLAKRKGKTDEPAATGEISLLPSQELAKDTDVLSKTATRADPAEV